MAWLYLCKITNGAILALSQIFHQSMPDGVTPACHVSHRGLTFLLGVSQFRKWQCLDTPVTSLFNAKKLEEWHPLPHLGIVTRVTLFFCITTPSSMAVLDMLVCIPLTGEMPRYKYNCQKKQPWAWNIMKYVTGSMTKSPTYFQILYPHWPQSSQKYLLPLPPLPKAYY